MRLLLIPSLLLMMVMAVGVGAQSNDTEVTPEVESSEESRMEQTKQFDGREWTLVWGDDFNGEAGTPVDEANWNHEIGGWGWGNNEREYYTDRVENSSLDGNGNLAIVAREENPEDWNCHYGKCEYTSARLTTQNKHTFTYGYIEARIKIPYGQGIWPAFWMLGADIPRVGWPRSGEIDILENIGREPRTVHGTVHGPGYSGADGIGGGIDLEGADYSDDFHTYAVAWEENLIRWYVDGQLYFTITPDDLPDPTRWAFDHDFFIILNVAVGGYWPGYPDATTEFPQTMLVDYVAVYQTGG